MKDYIYCNTCGKRFVIDEVEFNFNITYELLHLCERCKEND